MVRRLKELREAMKLSQKQFSIYTGISLVHIQKMEQGRANMGDKTIARIAETCGVTKDWLTGKSRLMFREEPKVYIPPKRPKIRIDDSFVWRR